MGQNGNSTTPTPPDTGDVDSDGKDTARPLDDKGKRPKRSPAYDSYESLAQRMTSGQLMGADAKRALSAPHLPRITPTRDEMATIPDDGSFNVNGDAGEPDLMLGEQASGAHAIPLDVSDSSPCFARSEAPTVVAPPPDTLPTTSRAQSDDAPVWHQESPTPNALDKNTIARVRVGGPAATRGPAVRKGTRDPEPLLEEAAQPNDLPLLDFDIDDAGDALSLVGARGSTPEVVRAKDPVVDLRDRYAVGDFTGAHEIAEAILTEDPQHAEALRFRESCRDVLIQMYSARLGSTTSVPRIVLPPTELQWLTLDHRSGFLLSCVDGMSTIDEILDVSGMSRLDTLRILYTLLQQQVIDVSRGG